MTINGITVDKDALVEFFNQQGFDGELVCVFIEAADND